MTRIQSLPDRLFEIIAEREKAANPKFVERGSKSLNLVEWAARFGVGHNTLMRWYKDRDHVVNAKPWNAIAQRLEVIPLVFTYGGAVEDLGVEGFLSGEPVENYFGRSIREHAEVVSLAKLARNVGMEPASFIFYLNKGKGSTGIEVSTLRVEQMASSVGLKPNYLVPIES